MGKNFTSNPLDISDFTLAHLLAEIANEMLKILTFLLFELQTSLRGQNGVEFYQDSTGHFGFYPSPLIGRDSQ